MSCNVAFIKAQQPSVFPKCISSEEQDSNWHCDWDTSGKQWTAAQSPFQELWGAFQENKNTETTPGPQGQKKLARLDPSDNTLWISSVCWLLIKLSFSQL